MSSNCLARHFLCLEEGPIMSSSSSSLSTVNLVPTLVMAWPLSLLLFTYPFLVPSSSPPLSHHGSLNILSLSFPPSWLYFQKRPYQPVCLCALCNTMANIGPCPSFSGHIREPILSAERRRRVSRFWVVGGEEVLLSCDGLPSSSSSPWSLTDTGDRGH